MCYHSTRANDAQNPSSENFWPLTSGMRPHLSSAILPVLWPSMRWCLTDLESTVCIRMQANGLVAAVAPRFGAFRSNQTHVHVSLWWTSPLLASKDAWRKPLGVTSPPHCPTAGTVHLGAPFSITPFLFPLHENSVLVVWHRREYQSTDVSRRWPPVGCDDPAAVRSTADHGYE